MAKLGVNGRAKGASFELMVAKVFSEALGVKLRRTPMSGGWSHDNPDVAGDLVCIEGEFPYCVECKNSEGWTFESLFKAKHVWFDKWWAQLLRECPNGKVPILVFSRARQPVFAAVKYQDNGCLDLHTPQLLIVTINSQAVVIVLLENLLPHISGLV